MTSWIASDLHFGHTNILGFQPDTRPFKTIEEMNESYIEEWNDSVAPDDTVFFLGDFAFLNAKAATNIARRLKGIKVLIPGNHDKRLVMDADFCNAWDDIRYYHEVDYVGPEGKHLLCMFHHPILEWSRCHRGSLHFHGHMHGKKTGLEHKRIMDVGVDATGQVVMHIDDAIRQIKDNELISHGSSKY